MRTCPRCCCPRPAGWLQPSPPTSWYLCFPLAHSREFLQGLTHQDWDLVHNTSEEHLGIRGGFIPLAWGPPESQAGVLQLCPPCPVQKENQESCLQLPHSYNTGNILCTILLIKTLLVDAWSNENQYTPARSKEIFFRETIRSTYVKTWPVNVLAPGLFS